MWFLIGLLLLILNIGCAMWNIDSEQYYLLPINGVGVYFSIRILNNA